MEKLFLQNCSLKNKKVLMRVDFNVPLDKEGNITDDSRIAACLPSIQYVLDQGGAVILMSHLGRPKNGKKEGLSLLPCADRLSQLLNRPVIFSEDCIGEKPLALAKALKAGQVILLENLRFHSAEESPLSDPSFAKQLADLGDIYVDDAFGAAHRDHSSITIIAQYFPGKAAAGLLLQKEIGFFKSLLTSPKRPFHAIIGGAKISSKINVLKVLLEKVDSLYIGGAMAYTFFKAQGIPIGDSLYEESYVNAAKEVLEIAKTKKIKLLLPIDNVVLCPNSGVQIIDASLGIPPGCKGSDIGPKTVIEFINLLSPAKTVLWNGPLGIFEDPRFAKGTEIIARALAKLPAMTIVGGGDSVAAIQAAGVADAITHLSTGGGASLEYIELGTLPGIEALSEA